MNKVLLSLASGLMVLSLVSCEKSLEVAGAAEGNSTLTITTRSGDDDAVVSYPVTVYALNSDGQCIRRQQLLTASDQLSMKLQPMTYQIYAVAGATDGDYSLPGQDDATATAPISLNADAQHGDLMSAKNTVTMSDSENTTLTLTLSRKVLLLESLSILNVPKSVTAVSVTLSPIYDELLLNGNYSSTTSTQTVTLTEQADGTTWQNTAPLYMLPSSENATVTVKFTRGEAVTSYAYTAPMALEANKKVNIKGTFTGTDQLTLTGIISGSKWDGTTTIEFTFDETGSTAGSSSSTSGSNSGNSGSTTPSTTTGENIMTGAVPEVNTAYGNCGVIIAVDTESDSEYNLATILHKSEANITGEGKTQEAVMAEIEAALPTFNTDDIKGWRIPTLQDAQAQFSRNHNSTLQSAFGVDAVMSTSDYYYYIDNDVLNSFKKKEMGYGTMLGENYTSGQHLRPVATLKFPK